MALGHETKREGLALAMSQDALNPQQFFHGTLTPFKSGELITPPASRGAISRFDPGTKRSRVVQSRHVFFSSDREEAGAYADEATDFGSKKGKKPRVYQVEPTGRYEPDPQTPGVFQQTAYRSHHPLKVVGEQKL